MQKIYQKAGRLSVALRHGLIEADGVAAVENYHHKRYPWHYATALLKLRHQHDQQFQAGGYPWHYATALLKLRQPGGQDLRTAVIRGITPRPY